MLFQFLITASKSWIDFVYPKPYKFKVNFNHCVAVAVLESPYFISFGFSRLVVEKGRPTLG